MCLVAPCFDAGASCFDYKTLRIYTPLDAASELGMTKLLSFG